MPRADCAPSTRPPTTPAAFAASSRHTPEAAPAQTPTGDALLLGLAALYRETWQLTTALDEARADSQGLLCDWLADRSNGHGRRNYVIEKAILATPAEGAAGAMVQIEALHLAIDGIGSTQDAASNELLQLCNHALYSILHVFERLTGRTIADGLDVMDSWSDWTITDAPRAVRLLEEYLAGTHQPQGVAA